MRLPQASYSLRISTHRRSPRRARFSASANPRHSARHGARRRARHDGIARVWLVAGGTVLVGLVGAGVGLGLSAGGNGKSATSTTTAPSTTTRSAPACPLTGAPAPGGTVPARPALAVKVDNYPTARPQSGIENADVIFEEPVEGGITRLVAVFQCQGADLVGPVRSARLVDIQILDQLSKPLFFHVGGIIPVLQEIAAANVVNLDLGTHGSIEQHPSGRVAPYDTYMSTAAGWGLDPSDTTPPAPLFTYSTTTPAGSPVSSIHIPFVSTNDVTWTWSSSANKWLLAYSGTPATVAAGTQISVPNIVVETVHVTYGPWTENAGGGLEVQSQLVGSGPLMVLRNGEMISGTWQRSSLDGTTSLLAANGSAIPLTPGPTWVEIVPSTVPVTTH